MSTQEFQRFRQRRVKTCAVKIGSGKTPSGGAQTYESSGVTFLRSQNVHFDGLRLDDVAYISEEAHREMKGTEVRTGDVLLNITGASLGRVAVAPDGLGKANVNQHVCILRPNPDTESRFLAYSLSSLDVQEQILAQQVGANRDGLNFEQVANLKLRLPDREEQRRISDFLDAETSRINRLIELRRNQIAILDARIGQLLDGVVAGDLDTLKKISADEPSLDWREGKISRLCEVIPGYAFPSSGFLTDSTGVRLLRGINVTVGATSWDEIATWDVTAQPVPTRFHLQVGDLTIGMDRPWISTGMRITFIQTEDLPTLLLQRVACLRPKGDVSMKYIRRVLESSNFRLEIESEMTGVSVPHVSGEQIGGFTFRLPSKERQESISDALERQIEQTSRLKSSIARQVALLSERRQALIMAAVTGQLDVTISRGGEIR
ncbi:MAG: restriction endonuclease subunit S [Pseudonocardiaceae bacterium]